MARLSSKSETMPAFNTAAEKRAWLLAQLAAVEREALLEEIAAGRNERITIILRDRFRIEVGDTVLYEGTNAAELIDALSSVVQALPLGSTLMVEAGKGGKVLSGGVEESAGPEPPAPASPRRRRTKL
jgi:hypothetical protein